MEKLTFDKSFIRTVTIKDMPICEEIAIHDGRELVIIDYNDIDALINWLTWLQQERSQRG